MTELSLHAQICDLVLSLKSKLEKKEFFTRLRWRAHKPFAIQVPSGQDPEMCLCCFCPVLAKHLLLTYRHLRLRHGFIIMFVFYVRYNYSSSLLNSLFRWTTKGNLKATHHQWSLTLCQCLALLKLSWDKNWDSHSPTNSYPRFYSRIALVVPRPGDQWWPVDSPHKGSVLRKSYLLFPSGNRQIFYSQWCQQNFNYMPCSETSKIDTKRGYVMTWSIFFK